MKHQKIVINLLPNLLILVTILFLSTTWTIADEIEDESEFDYIKESKKGPSHWGELKKEWATCKNGVMQSPIDMSSNIVRVVPKLDELKKNYKPQNAIIRNRGHDIQLKWQGDAGSININATEFFLRQMHWHSPSEHTINGQRYDMELHMVHESLKINGKSKIAVVGLLYKIGGPDPLLTKCKLMEGTFKGVALRWNMSLPCLSVSKGAMNCNSVNLAFGALNRNSINLAFGQRGSELQLDQPRLRAKEALNHKSVNPTFGKKGLNFNSINLAFGQRGYELQLGQPRLKVKGALNHKSVNLTFGKRCSEPQLSEPLLREKGALNHKSVNLDFKQRGSEPQLSRLKPSDFCPHLVTLPI
ncbi:unnamed protein product [Vicia faba]|uniref:Carbonic anhydrase n=1 Tax=Vicia faba TaxID=3906 RepID=A0AAV0YD24_VICFA|nr:unnamed protein product [Vicia faba]